MRTALQVLIFMLVLSCQGIQPVPKPDPLIEKATMENIIYDITLINSARGYNIQRFTQTGVNPKCHVFEKYEIDSAQYAQNILYYSASLEEYGELIDTVRKRIEKEHKILDSVYQEDKRVKDSMRNARGRKLKEKQDSINVIQPNRGILPKTAIEPPIL